MSPRRNSRESGLVTIWWRDIPAQVTASASGETVKALLDARFQHAIDQAAIVADLTDTQSYVAEWRREASPVNGDDLDALVATAAGRLEADYPADRLADLVRSGGVDPRPGAT